MIRVKFTSKYEEWDRFGNGLSITNSFEALGSGSEVSSFIKDVSNNILLPGTTRLKAPDKLLDHLSVKQRIKL